MDFMAYFLTMEISPNELAPWLPATPIAGKGLMASVWASDS